MYKKNMNNELKNKIFFFDFFCTIVVFVYKTLVISL